MNPLDCPPARRLRAALLVLSLGTALVATAASAAHRAEPPAYPDAAHVLNGCYLSTAAYLARFRAEYPAERSAPLTVTPRKFQGKHTIAVVTWAGRWWGRDEYFGIFPIDCAVANEPNASQLTRHAEVALARHSDAEFRAGRGATAPRPATSLSATERTRNVTRAATLVPDSSEIFWVIGGREEMPVLFFRPAPGWVAVYDPLHGTARAECAASPAAVVRSVAERLGYRVTDVRADFRQPAGALVATTTPTRGDLVR